MADSQMSTSYGNEKNVRLAASWAFFKFHDSAVVIPLGYTDGGIQTSISSETTGVEADQSSTPIITTLSNVECSVTTPLMEWTHDNMLLAFPGAEARTDAQNNTYVAMTGNVVTKYGTLRLHPTDMPDNDFTKDHFYTNVTPSPNLEFTMDGEAAQILPIEWIASPGKRPHAEKDGDTAYYDHTPTNAIVRVQSIEITPATLTMTVGQTETLEVAVTPVYATDKYVTFTSSDEAVATLSDLGEVYAEGVGTATITATSRDGSKTDTANVTVS
jgi:uncharacterized protein YjdB